MDKVWLYALLSTLVVSAISLIGVTLFALKSERLQRILLLLISFSVGALLGNAFFHLIPESYFHIENAKLTSWLIIGGFMLFFFIDQFLHTHQTGNSSDVTKAKPYGYLSLYADGIHNFTDGILIGAAWMFSPELGLATTITVVLHEIPQEISDFGILLKAGFSKKKALLYNFIVATSAIVGTVLALWLGHEVEHFSIYVLPIASGGFVYLAGTSLLPEVLKSTKKGSWIYYSLFLLLGLGLMYYFSLSGGHQH
ncbi:MAG: ZIP family metal transporter [Porphyromonadaceae bacterium]|jgi:zinc and cadmium transporter|nr:ZIP family metal transporter [Porphyromonadaceae bacterium]